MEIYVEKQKVNGYNREREGWWKAWRQLSNGLSAGAGMRKSGQGI